MDANRIEFSRALLNINNGLKMDERTGQLGDGSIGEDERGFSNLNEEIRHATQRAKAENYFKEKKEDEIKRREEMVRRMVGVVLVASFGFLFIISAIQKISIIDFVSVNAQFIFGAAIVIVATVYLLAPNIFSGVSFRDVDLRRREKTVLTPAAAWPFPTNSSAEYDDDEDDEIEMFRSEDDKFQRYFMRISNLLQEKAFDAEEKASLLLDKGSNYTWAGIAFFVISIVAWQALAWIHGFKPEFIYGIASCSALFLFIEILSGWYLKQYRHYVDTSTYLLKIKSMFDKFMLAHLSRDSLDVDDKIGRRQVSKALLAMLEKEIRWPNAYMHKREDANFAIEAIETLSKLKKGLKKEKKGKRDAKA